MSQFCVFLLMLDALWICIGLAANRVMWGWIVLYWAILTLKNYFDWRKRK